MIVLLDIDNTLIDFNECARQSIIRIFNDFNLPYSDNVFKTFTDENIKIWKRLENGEITKEELKFGNLPDIILLDGGQGHVNFGKKVVDMLGFSIPVFGIVKDDKHKTRGLVSPDGEIYIEKTSEAFRLITNIQDEMHRRAIDYQAKLGKKSSLESELENIAGVGDTRRKSLLRHFKSLNKIKSASVEDILKVKSIDQKTAQNIYEYFKRSDD